MSIRILATSALVGPALAELGVPTATQEILLAGIPRTVAVTAGYISPAARPEWLRAQLPWPKMAGCLQAEEGQGTRCCPAPGRAQVAESKGRRPT